MSVTDTSLTSRGLALKDLTAAMFRGWPLVLAAVVTALVFLLPSAAMGIDDTLHTMMVHALVERGSLSFGSNGGVDGAPALLKLLTHDVGVQVMPQYPSGFAFLAAPFYTLFGLRGLVLMNALSLVAILWAVRRMALVMTGDARLALHATLLAGLGSFLTAQAFIILPHLTSLALILLACERAVHAAYVNPERATLWLATSGLALGLAINLRVDVVLSIVALLIWVRLFALPSRRLPGAALLLGLLPGFLFASWLNLEKFGEFVPISYGPKPGGNAIGDYAGMAGAIGVLLAACFALDTSSLRFAGLYARLREPRVQLCGVLLVALTVALLPPARTLAHNAWVLVVNLQQASDWQVLLGMTRDSWGFASFYGLEKKALLQSMPFVVMAIVPIAMFLRGEAVKALALCFLMIGAHIAFFTLKQWHGGYAMNMRYFTPALPFLCILSAWALRRFEAGRAETGIPLLAILAGAFVGAGVLALPLLAGMISPLAKVAYYYGPLVCAGLLLAALAIWLSGRATQVTERLTVALIAASVAQGVLMSGQDAVSYQLRTAKMEAFNAASADIIPPSALIVTLTEEHFLTAMVNGANLVNRRDMNRDHSRAVAAARAFEAAGRCVYLHSSGKGAPIELALGGEWVDRPIPGAEGHLAWVRVRVENVERCPVG